MKIRLAITKPKQNDPDIFDFDVAYCLLGRSAANLVIADPRCSQQHLIFFQGSDSRLWIRDLESTNGTFLNGQRIDESPVNLGDEIKVGKTTIVVLEFLAVEQIQALAGTPKTGRGGVPAQAGSPAEPTQEGTAVRALVEIKKKHIAQESGLLNRWPDNLRAAPKDVQNKFVDYVDEQGTCTRINLKDLRKVG